MTLSSLVEEMILWRSCCFKFTELLDKVLDKVIACNSIMIEERNPEVAKFIAATNTLLTITEGFLLSCNKKIYKKVKPCFSL